MAANYTTHTFSADEDVDITISGGGFAENQPFSVTIERGGSLGGGVLKLEPTNKPGAVVDTDNDWSNYGDGTSELTTGMQVGHTYPVTGVAKRYRLTLSGSSSPSLTVHVYRPY